MTGQKPVIVNGLNENYTGSGTHGRGIMQSQAQLYHNVDRAEAIANYMNLGSINVVI